MAGEQLRMPIAAVRVHADAVDTAAASMQTGRDAAAHVHLGNDAYGQLCSFLPSLIAPLGDMVVTALGDSAAALRETATNLRTAADAAQTSDNAAADRVARAGRRLELPL